MIRAVPSNASDNVYCTLLAHSAIHGAMAGYTGFTVGPVNGRHAYIPFYVSSSLARSNHLIFFCTLLLTQIFMLLLAYMLFLVSYKTKYSV